jgi:DNA-binding MarR family transcriptional regulator
VCTWNAGILFICATVAGFRTRPTRVRKKDGMHPMMNVERLHRPIGPMPEAVSKLFDGIDLTGLDMLRLVRIATNLYDMVGDEQLEAVGLSGPRWRLLLRLHREELGGNRVGVSPTHLSHCQNVSKNTISALLRGLEEQHLVERTLDPTDKRAFRIRLTDAGRDIVVTTAPRHLTHLNDLATALAPEEQTQLITLLEKLCRSLAARNWHKNAPNDDETAA